MAMEEAARWYRDNAEEYADTNPDLPIRKWVEWPAVRSLLPDLSGARIVDAGCGDGTYSRQLAERGGDVLGIDSSQELLDVAAEQHGEHVEFRSADLREPFTFLDNASVDVIVSQLALDHIADWQPVFEEFYRVLVSGGCLVLSASHPPTIYAKILLDDEDQFDLDTPSYFETESWRPVWGADDDTQDRVQKYRRSLSTQVNTAFDAGFVMDRLEEATPTEEFKQKKPDTYARWTKRPSTFICYRFRKLA